MLFKLGTILSGFFIIIFTNNSIAFETVANSAIIFDTNSKLVLMQKNADLALPPASMSKLMTLNMVLNTVTRPWSEKFNT